MRVVAKWDVAGWKRCVRCAMIGDRHSARGGGRATGCRVSAFSAINAGQFGRGPFPHVQIRFPAIRFVVGIAATDGPTIRRDTLRYPALRVLAAAIAVP